MKAPKLEWNEELVIGVAAMDAEHKQLVAAMDQVRLLSESGATKNRIDLAIQDLGQLTHKHFADEERHMEKIGYPDRARHGLIHKDLLQKFGEHYAAFRAGDGKVSVEFLRFLVNWLSAHIKVIDRKYAQHPVAH